MRHIEFTPEHYRVSDFLNWAEAGVLQLNPGFQRRPVWNASQKSYFIDTLARGYPVPQLIIRERVEIESASTIREVVDGQQRLRTVLGYVRPASIPDYNERKDAFTVRKIHNSDLAGKPFRDLDVDTQKAILGFRFNVLILPDDTDDREVLRIFSRMNSTGVKLNAQELRNAEYSGPFKLTMYDLALEQLDRWRAWKIFSDTSLSRMAEVEFTSDLIGLMIKGVATGNKQTIDAMYKMYEVDFPHEKLVAERFRRTMDVIEDRVGEHIASSVFRRQMHFYGLFAMFYDRLFGLGSELQARRARTDTLPSWNCLAVIDQKLDDEDVPPDVLRAISGAASDRDRRATRIEWMESLCPARVRRK